MPSRVESHRDKAAEQEEKIKRLEGQIATLVEECSVAREQLDFHRARISDIERLPVETLTVSTTRAYSWLVFMDPFLHIAHFLRVSQEGLDWYFHLYASTARARRFPIRLQALETSCNVRSRSLGEHGCVPPKYE